LARRKVPFLFVTGYGREDLPEEFGHETVLGKPFSRTDLLKAAVALFIASSGTASHRWRAG
jgi:CheY-like chemotaxis protein